MNTQSVGGGYLSGKQLIIAEKPSLARNIAGAIGDMQKKGTYFENDRYLVTWAFGHLFSLCDIEDYEEAGKGEEPKRRWKLENLPCFPDRFKFQLKRGEDGKPDEGVLRQYASIRALCNRQDVSAIINAGDADREGEVIVRLCVLNATAGRLGSKRFLRLWLPDQTPQTVRAALSDLKDEAEYDNLSNEGMARTYIDWLYGVNLTRYATLKTGKLLRVGRVIVPIVKAIYDRDMAIRSFVPDIYYGLASAEKTGGETVELLSKLRFDKDKKAEAEETCARYNACEAVVAAKKKQKTVVQPGKLYSLSKLQNVLGKKYKMSMAESLAIVQSLYERGFVTYPRTNSEYLATAEKDKIRQIIGGVKKLGYPVAFKDKKTIFDDSKIESHSALTPTYKLPAKDALSPEERQVYGTIFKRFVAVFCEEDCIADKTEIKIRVGNLEEFTLTGTVIREKGWTKYDDYAGKDKLLPPLEKGDRVNILFQPVEKKTSPPKHYTIETLNNYLKNPFREEKAAQQEAAASPDSAEDDTEDYRAIFEGLELGTEATRTGIIDNARKSGYIALKKDVYTILPDGEFLIRSLTDMNISMDKYKTSQMGRVLKRIYHGKMTVNAGVIEAEKEIAEVFAPKSAVRMEDDTEIGFLGDLCGKCPLCGAEVVRTKFGYGCSGYREGCKFGVQGSICGRSISIANVRMLLDVGHTSRIRGFVSKNGKPFSAALVLRDGRAVFDFQDRAAPGASADRGTAGSTSEASSDSAVPSDQQTSG